MAARSSVRPKNSGCKERQRLVDEFIAAARELIRLQNAQMVAVAGQQEGSESNFDKPLQQARERKEEALRAYARHLEQHGCGHAQG